ncbi:glycosyltransferase family 2 protein [Jannaschia sp.]|nr:glycosyltransferase family 2 protein [Jannaschia sp.]
MTPRLSIVVPAYGAAPTLPATLASLTAQSLRDIEIIVVDDGGPDACGDIARQAARTDARIRVIHQANRGLAGARNTGIHAARADVIGFCDADDLWSGDKAARHVAHLARAPQVGLSYAGSRLIDEMGAPTGHAQRPRLGRVDAAQILKRNPVGNGSAPVLRRAALDALAWTPAQETTRPWVFDETLRQSEDIECWLRLALTTDWTIEGIDGLLTDYRIVQSGLSANTEAQLATWERATMALAPRAPAFFARHHAAARAYQLRYLARRAISAGDGARARALLARSNRASLRPWREEPGRTALTYAAAQGLRFGPAPIALAARLLARRAA